MSISLRLKYLIFLCIVVAKTYSFDIKSCKVINATKQATIDCGNQEVVWNGIKIPSNTQNNNNYIQIKIDLKNYNTQEKLYYKVYFQNTTYKYNEEDFKTYNDLLSENFYGSWQNYSTEFKVVPQKVFIDSLVIEGNPRNERKYYGSTEENFLFSSAQLKGIINFIQSSPEWNKSIEEKAVRSGIDYLKQLELDALYYLRSKRNQGEINHKWKCNPRMGKYEFLIVVCNETQYKTIPNYIKNVTVKNDFGKYINPFYYFLKQDSVKKSGIKIYQIKNGICAKFNFNKSGGIYVDYSEFPNKIDGQKTNENCNSSANKFYTAQFEQFFHGENSNFILNTIPLIKDVISNEYVYSDYTNAMDLYNSKDRIKSIICNTKEVCKTVSLNEKGNIELITPGSTSLIDAVKENVGVKTRVGFTYGKITAKVRLPKIINDSDMWNGLTDAIWLLYQDKQEWNNRRYSSTGYIPKGETGSNSTRIHETHYSEIDFEIVKTVEQWPASSYKNGLQPTKKNKRKGEVIIATTNWDLANVDPIEFHVGVKKIKYKTNRFLPHRWDNWYHAVTNRYAIKQNEILGTECYFQFEWNPREIIWRVGKNKNKMKIVGYQNEQITSIPNNQMILVFTQEFHLSSWWPPAPYEQDNIPFPKNNIKGEIISVEVE